MHPSDERLTERVAALETRLSELSQFLRSALEYLSSDPGSSVTKSRILLEKIVVRRFEALGEKAPSRSALAEILCNKAFTAGVPRRIIARMNAIREMANLGPHGEELLAGDAARVMADLIDVVDWHLATSGTQSVDVRAPRQMCELLPQLILKYPDYLRQDIVSVQFIQSDSRCWLEVTTRDVCGESHNETARREDLGFISSGSKNMFDPTQPIEVNAKLFLDMDTYSIINCTNLFNEVGVEAALYEYEVGVISEELYQRLADDLTVSEESYQRFVDDLTEEREV